MINAASMSALNWTPVAWVLERTWRGGLKTAASSAKESVPTKHPWKDIEKSAL